MIGVVQTRQSGSGASAAAAFVELAATGNRVVAFLAQSSSTVAPTVKDSGTGGASGWTVSTAKALGASSANSTWVAEKVVGAGETFTTVTMTPGTGGTAQGVCIAELSGTSGVVEATFHTDNAASGKTSTSPAVTTLDPGDIVLAAVGTVTGSLAGTSWTGSMTRMGTEATRCLGGYYLPGSRLEAATFTASWETARLAEMLVVVLKPSALSDLAMVI